jgi:alpha-tubulin suppressor-like RCC1 family protein
MCFKSYGQEAPEENVIQVKFKAVAAGNGYSVALKEDGTVIAWGYNYHDDEDRCDVPYDLANVKSISTGGAHTLALKEDGTVVAWGDNRYGQCNVPAGLKNIREVAAGEVHSVAVKEDGTLVAWGYNLYNQCNIPEGLSNVKAISAGMHHTAALKEDGTVAAWGDNYYGQCNVDGLTGIKAIDAGFYNTLVIKEDGTVDAFGDFYGAREIKDAVLVSAGYDRCVIVKNDGTIEIFYGNQFTAASVPENLQDIKSASAGLVHIILLKNDGTVESIGDAENLDSLSISGNITSDIIEPYITPFLKEGFKIEVMGTNKTAATNRSGAFRFSDLFKSRNDYSIKISKPGYLARYINNISTESSGIMFGTINSPIVLLAGDIDEDDTINIADVVKMTKAFNTNSTDAEFDCVCDLNKDNQVNMIDAIILARNFNKTSDNY